MPTKKVTVKDLGNEMLGHIKIAYRLNKTGALFRKSHRTGNWVRINHRTSTICGSSVPENIRNAAVQKMRVVKKLKAEKKKNSKTTGKKRKATNNRERVTKRRHSLL